MTEGLSRLEAIRARFLDRLAEQQATLKALSNNRDGNREAMDIAHKIAGLAGSLGYPELSAAASDVETALLDAPALEFSSAPQFERLSEVLAETLATRP